MSIAIKIISFPRARTKHFVSPTHNELDRVSQPPASSVLISPKLYKYFAVAAVKEANGQQRARDIRNLREQWLHG